MSLLSAHFSGLLMSLWIAALPSSILNGSPNLVLSTDLLRAHSDLSPMLLMKTLNSTGPGIDPWGTSLVTNWSSAEICTTDHNSLSPAVQPIFHTPYHPVIHSLSHQSDNLNLEKWKLSSVKALINLKWTTSAVLPLHSPTNFIIESNKVRQAQLTLGCSQSPSCPLCTSKYLPGGVAP